MPKADDTSPDPSYTDISKQEEHRIQAIKTHLERLAVLECDIVNSRDFAHASPAGQEMLSHISSTFRASHDNVPALMTWEEFMDQWRAMYAESPEIRLEVTSVSCNVHSDLQGATVYLDSVLKGLAPDLVVGAMGELQWKLRKTDSRWMLMKYCGLRTPTY